MATAAFLQAHSPDGGFLQSEHWRVFQERAGHTVIPIEGDGFFGNGIVQHLPLVGEYLYFPRGPVIDFSVAQAGSVMEAVLAAGRTAGAGWLRIEPSDTESLERLRHACPQKIVKAPHDTQPREILVTDLSPEEHILLGQMKPKTRYNIGVAEKHTVKVFETREPKYQKTFIDLIVRTAHRKTIIAHEREHYENFFAALPEDVCHLFVAELDGEVLAANLVLVSGRTATYFHGGSSGTHRDAMAPFLLQWEQMRYAKNLGCTRYDFGGVRVTTRSEGNDRWDGITRFKQGFAPHTPPLVFPGSHDIVLDAKAYFLYDHLRLLKESFGYIRKFVGR